MDKIKVGMIGAGNWANVAHYPSLAEFKDVGIAAICDLDEDRLKKTADRYNVTERFTDYRLMLKKVILDAVYVIMAPVPFGRYRHADSLVDVVVHCLRKKKNVFIEKPPGVNVEQTRKMAEEAITNNCKTMVGFNRRFIPVLREAKRIVEDRGMITHCVATFHKNHISHPTVWGGVDILTADVIHAVDPLRWMGGEVRKVTSHVDKFYADGINSFNALVIFENGCVGHLNSCYSAGGRVHSFEMHAKGISAYVNVPFEIDKQEGLILRDDEPYGKAELIRNQELVEGPELYKCYGYYQENRHFIDCIKEDKEPDANFRDAVKTMDLIDRIKRGY